MKKAVALKAGGKVFTGWSTHAEVGSKEHGGGENENHKKRAHGEHGEGHGERERRAWWLIKIKVIYQIILVDPFFFIFQLSITQ